MELAVVILAAGSGTRMKSSLPKVLHPVSGKPMVCYVADVADSMNSTRIVTVVSDGKAQIEQCLNKKIDYVQQSEQLGTAHAVLQTEPKLKSFEGNVLVLYGDTPLIQGDSLKEMVAFHVETGAVATVATANLKNPFGYGRIIRSDNKIIRIVEEKDANVNERQINEINTGICCFQSRVLFEKLKQVKTNNKQKEYYLTDVVEMLVAERALVESFELQAEETLGVNSRAELAEANRLMYQRIMSKWLDNQVTILDPSSTYIENDVEIGPETIIHPQTFLRGKTKVDANCEIGPFCVITDAKIGQGSRVGPFSHLRPGTDIEANGKVGAFSEVKNSKIGAGSKVPHLSYIGDTEIEEDVNVGAGTITCNYDGQSKKKTLIKKGAFIGSDTMLVAPVTIGKNAYTGAGSVITDDVPDDALAVERSEQKNIKGYSKKKRKN